MRIKFIINYLQILVLVSSVLLACDKKVKSDSEGKRVIDIAELLTDSEEKELLTQILNLEKSIGSQIGIVLIDTLNGEKIEDFSLSTAERMNLGRSEFNDGLLITFSSKDGKIRIEVGYGLEKIIKDEIAARIVREDMAPKFKKKKYYDGLNTAVSKIKKMIEDNKELVGQRP
jgi:uncharacterized protein